MPFLQPATGIDGGSHPDAYWTIAEVRLLIDQAAAYAIYRAYHDFATWSTPPNGVPVPVAGVEVAIAVSGSSFETLMYRYRSEPETKVTGLIEELAAAHPAFVGATWVDFPALPEE